MFWISVITPGFHTQEFKWVLVQNLNVIKIWSAQIAVRSMEVALCLFLQDTTQIHVHSDVLPSVQVLGNQAVNDGVGVYWCFYAGGSFEEIQARPFWYPSV